MPHSDYPDYEEWVEKAHAQFKSEEKRALVALSYRNVVGAVVYQRHKLIRSALEIKNITVRPDMQGRFIASFLLRNAEIEGASDFKIDQVLVDAKARNMSIRAFFFQQGYRVLGSEDLYGLGAGKDLVYGKRIGRPR
jgi:ribosomal protein S18 acetylase RimI-like enzyme